MALLSRRARVAARTARAGIRTYGKAKRAQGRASARGDGGPVKRSLAAGLGIGALAAFLLDPKDGRRRRNVLRGRAISKLHRRRDYDDVTLTRKVETEIFRDPDAPKGRVSVNTEHGVVFLRGAVERNQIRELGEAAGKVDGVERVENLLHTPDQPPPSR
jgi:hypothetical protein